MAMDDYGWDVGGRRSGCTARFSHSFSWACVLLPVILCLNLADKWTIINFPWLLFFGMQHRCSPWLNWSHDRAIGCRPAILRSIDGFTWWSGREWVGGRTCWNDRLLLESASIPVIILRLYFVEAPISLPLMLVNLCWSNDWANGSHNNNNNNNNWPMILPFIKISCIGMDGVALLAILSSISSRTDSKWRWGCLRMNINKLINGHPLLWFTTAPRRCGNRNYLLLLLISLNKNYFLRNRARCCFLDRSMVH